MSVAEQLAIALFRFGHYGNAANIMKTALWAGVGYGTVHLATNRIIKAVCGEQFRRAALHWPMRLPLRLPNYGWKITHALPGGMDGQWWMVPWFHYMLDQHFLEIPGMIASLITL